MASKRKDAGNAVHNRMPDDDIRFKEEEQRRLNEELEARTAMLMKETEDALRQHEAMFSKKHSMLDNVDLNADDAFDWEDEAGETKQKKTISENKVSAKAQDSSRSAAGGSQRKVKTPTPRTTKPKVVRNSHPIAVVPKEKDLAVDDDDYSAFGDYNPAVISNLEVSVDNHKRQPAQVFEDVVPAVANEMGSENLIRFLKAKLQVMQEEVGRLSHEVNVKDENIRETQAKFKEVEEEKNRLQRTNTAQLAQIQKHKKLMDDAKDRADDLDVQLSACKKELESTKKSQKQQSNSQGTLEVRLNRALEECEKYKTQLEKVKAGTKENVEVERRKLEELTLENKRLEKQKSELMNGYKKQLKLIDILKRKQMHIEAAKMLSFTEEEFVKAMDWGNN